MTYRMADEECERGDWLREEALCFPKPSDRARPAYATKGWLLNEWIRDHYRAGKTQAQIVALMVGNNHDEAWSQKRVAMVLQEATR